MLYRVTFTVTIDVPAQGHEQGNELMAAGMASKFIAENCQFDCANDVDIPAESRVALTVEPLGA